MLAAAARVPRQNRRPHIRLREPVTWLRQVRGAIFFPALDIFSPSRCRTWRARRDRDSPGVRETMKWLLSGVSVLAFGYASSGLAADIPVEALVKAPPLWSWAGLYIGVHAGSAMGLNTVNDPLGPSIFGDQIHSPGAFGGGQIGFNWRAPSSSWVFGVEADASLANLDGTNTCFAFSGTFTSLNCRAHTDAFGTATGRIGLAFGPFGRSLAYAKGGLAWGHSNVDMIINNSLFVVDGTSSTGFTAVGWTIPRRQQYR